MASPARADLGERQELVGFNKTGRQVLVRVVRDGALSLVQIARDSSSGPLPEGLDPRSFRFGTPMKGDRSLLKGRGLVLRLDRSGKHLWVGRGGAASVSGLSAREDCPFEAMQRAMVGPDRGTLAVLLRSACKPGGEVQVLYLPKLVQNEVLRGQSLLDKGRLAEADRPLRTALALSPGHVQAIYLLARRGALLADEAEALSWLRRLRAINSGPSRRLLVKARWDLDFRLIKDGAGFKAAVDY